MDNAIFYKEFIDAMTEADRLSNEFIDISDYQCLFEADDPAVKESINKNKQTQVKSQNAIMKAINATKRIIQNIINAIKNFFAELKMDKEEKELYDKFKEMCKTDPSLKNKKVTVKDYRAVIDQYNKAIAEAEELDRKLKANEKNPSQELLDSVVGYAKDTAKAVGVSVTMDALDKSARSNKAFASVLYKQLENDNKILNELQKSAGEAEMNKLKNRSKILGKRISIRAAIIRKREGQFECVKDALTDSFSAAKDLIGGKFTKRSSQLAGHLVRNETLQNNVIKPVGHVAADGVKTGLKSAAKNKVKTTFTKNGRYAKLEAELKNKNLTDEQRKNIEAKMNKMVEKENKRSIYKNTKSDSSDKSLFSFITGIH